MFDAEPIDSPHGKVAVTPSCVAGGLRFGWPIGIASIGRTVKRLGGPDVGIQRPIRLTRRVMDDGDCSHVRANETADSRPVSVNREKVAIIIGIHMVTEVLLFLIGDAFDRLRFNFGAGKRRQEQARQNRDNGNHHEKFD